VPPQAVTETAITTITSATVLSMGDRAGEGTQEAPIASVTTMRFGRAEYQAEEAEQAFEPLWDRDWLDRRSPDPTNPIRPVCGEKLSIDNLEETPCLLKTCKSPGLFAPH
jgi:hypothetical protein